MGHKKDRIGEVNSFWLRKQNALILGQALYQWGAVLSEDTLIAKP